MFDLSLHACMIDSPFRRPFQLNAVAAEGIEDGV